MEQALVSVCVITYNSAKTIVETLDSIFSQTYENIELIISDDYSTDDTIRICEEWKKVKGGRFRHCELITTEANTGTSANCNRALKAAKGDWIKTIAGDDLLNPNAIEVMTGYCVANHKEVCFSRLDYFGDEERILEKRATYEPFYEKYKTLDKKGQYRLLLKQCVLPGASMFYSKKLIEEINYIDESYPFYEEWPTFLKFSEKGYDVPYIQDQLVKYRCEQSGLSAQAKYDDSLKGRTYKIARRKLTDDESRFYYEYRRPRLLRNFSFYTVWCSDIKYKLYKICTKPTISMIDRIHIGLLKLIRPLSYKYAWNKFMHKIMKS